VASDHPQPLLDEPRLIESACRGDRPAFAALIERYWDRLYRWLCQLTRDPHAAEDLAQETFLKAFAGLGKFRPDSNFAAWLFRIAHNNFANHYRAACRRREPLPDDLPSLEAGPEERLQSQESIEQLQQALKRLPPDFLAPLLLRIDGMSFRQIAEALGLTEETARWRVFKARQKLLGLLAPAREPERS
jgi:RNA polymerase sigma-70 factor (ECF subfamily)